MICIHYHYCLYCPLDPLIQLSLSLLQQVRKANRSTQQLLSSTKSLKLSFAFGRRPIDTGISLITKRFCIFKVFSITDISPYIISALDCNKDHIVLSLHTIRYAIWICMVHRRYYLFIILLCHRRRAPIGISCALCSSSIWCSSLLGYRDRWIKEYLGLEKIGTSTSYDHRSISR